MPLAAALLPLLPKGKGIIAFVGAGGKTSALFSLASALSTQPHPVLLSSTTHLLDPRLEPGRPALRLLLRPDLEGQQGTAPLPAAQAGLTLLMARATEPPEKLKGIHPCWFPALKASWDLLLVEADGSKRLPVKAPAEHEPVLPLGADLVVGVVGLDCLGRPMDGRVVHRPEHFHRVTGCHLGEALRWEHLVALAEHSLGLFKGVTGPRVLLLNKADRAPFQPTADQLAALPADWVLLTSLAPPERVMVMVKGTRP
jgi:probable selenium-dependent hydroxylase accessory protein YqeC